MNLYEQWLQAAADLKRMKGEELALRLEICKDVLGDKLEGTQNEFADNHRFKITATAKLNRTIDRSVLETIWEDLTDEERQCIDYKPSLVLGNYRQIEEEGGKLIDAVTVKPATPTLKIVEVEQ